MKKWIPVLIAMLFVVQALASEQFLLNKANHLFKSEMDYLQRTKSMTKLLLQENARNKRITENSVITAEICASVAFIAITGGLGSSAAGLGITEGWYIESHFLVASIPALLTHAILGKAFGYIVLYTAMASMTGGELYILHVAGEKTANAITEVPKDFNARAASIFKKISSLSEVHVTENMNLFLNYGDRETRLSDILVPEEFRQVRSDIQKLFNEADMRFCARNISFFGRHKILCDEALILVSVLEEALSTKIITNYSNLLNN